MLERDGIVEALDKVRSDLDARDVDDDRLGGRAGLGGAGVVEGDHAEAVHDPVEDVGEGAPGLVALDRGDFDPAAGLDV